MSFPFKIDSGTQVVHVRFTGLLDLQAVFEGFAAYLAHPLQRAGQSCLVDLSRVERFAIDFPGVCDVVDRLKTVQDSRSASDREGAAPRHALYAPSDIAFGTSRMYQSIAQGVLRAEIGVFRDLAEAHRFLDLEVAVS
ncbi:hypothetical protein [Citreimonas sp.]|uniref:hypothetical protein n=1 Tax=Citreimonas sp. TaxID=3036715 RepID=UPI0035C7A593